jgi:hypothetical protein
MHVGYAIVPNMCQELPNMFIGGFRILELNKI